LLLLHSSNQKPLVRACNPQKLKVDSLFIVHCWTGDSNYYQTNHDGDSSIVSIELESSGGIFLPRVGTKKWLAASGFIFTTRKFKILGINTDVYKATAYS
jgi:hypothetical protein